MELRDLKAFVTLGEVLHFGQAAVRQHVTLLPSTQASGTPLSRWYNKMLACNAGKCCSALFGK